MQGPPARKERVDVDDTQGQGIWWRRRLVPRRSGHVNVGRGERFASAAVGALLFGASLARRGPSRLVLGALGTLGLLRGVTGHSRAYEIAGVSSASLEEGAGISIDESVTINAPVMEVYGRWADVTWLPRYLGFLRSVTETAPGVTTWVLELPGGRDVTFDAEVIERREGELVAWHTLPGASLEHSGSVHFRDVPGRGTEMRLHLRFVAPGGVAGFAAARAARALEERGVAEELRRFKSIVEAGEAPTTQGQPSGREAARELPPVVATAPVSTGGELGGFLEEA